jgi:hypothetical protein
MAEGRPAVGGGCAICIQLSANHRKLQNGNCSAASKLEKEAKNVGKPQASKNPQGAGRHAVAKTQNHDVKRVVMICAQFIWIREKDRQKLAINKIS